MRAQLGRKEWAKVPPNASNDECAIPAGFDNGPPKPSPGRCP